MNKRPNSLRHLDSAIRRACGNSTEAYIRARTIMANAIVANALPNGVIKGGTAIKMRFGDNKTRFTTDLDTATATDPTLYAMQLGQALSQGWEGFTGRVVPREPASPNGVPNKYVMQPFDVKLSYMGKPWCTVPLEVGHNEIGDADIAEWIKPADAASLFEAVGFPAPGKAPLMPLCHQIAQKIHAASSIGDRARDLIDLQLIFSRSEVDLSELKRTCERLFAYRKAQAWPPRIIEQPGWVELYAIQAEGLPVAQSVSEAIVWANSLIDQIHQAN